MTDDTHAINKAISSGNRCGRGCDSSTTKPALVYFPSGTYIVSKPVLQYYYTQMIGDARDLPTIKGSPDFSGLALIDADPSVNGTSWYTNQNNFFRSIRNFVIDLTDMPLDTGAGIHWQVAQATSLQNVRFEMVRGGENNKQQGIFMDSGSGGFLTDLTFNGGNYGMFLGNQQFTTRNLTFNDCNTAVLVNWNWAWTFKSLEINNCQIGLNMSNTPSNQTVGSVLVLDSKLTDTPVGVVTAFTEDSIPIGGGVLVLDNVDFSGSDVAVAGADGTIVLEGGGVVASYVQGHAYTKSDVFAKDDMPSSMASASAMLPASLSLPNPVSWIPKPTSSSAEASASTYTLQASTPSSPSSSAQVPTVSTSPSQVVKSRVQTVMQSQAKPRPLLDNNGKVFERSKPQYENHPASSFISVRNFGAKGDGKTDDTQVLQAIFAQAEGKDDQIIFFDHGSYVITDTILIPKGTKVVGEVWPVLMAHGRKFSNQYKPIPMLQVGREGEIGSVEISDITLQTKGPAPGAILMQWNLAEEEQGSAAMWDTHFRIGGSAGTGLQSDTCAKTPNKATVADPQCVGSFLLFHVTEHASAYVENAWFWTADHELDLTDYNQINIFNGRGVLIESHKPVWLYGTASEHNQLYNYQLSGASNVFMGLIQTETPYYQANPNALTPFTPQKEWDDPDFSNCRTASCAKAWGLRIRNSSDSYVYGAGLYSFYENHRQTCLDSESCQENMVEVESSDVKIYGLSTKASVNMVTSGGRGLVPEDETTSNFCSTIAFFDAAGM